MPPKRPNGDGDEVSGRDKKKVKIAAARTIAVQGASAYTSNNASLSSSGPQAAASSSKLPNTIDVERFVEARAFEITAMHDAMKSASASSTHRVWQTLPRHLRRRAASHDVRRVPARLLDRARAEMDVVRKKALGRSMPKRGKARRPLATESFLKRQRDKSWLETHIWHARRMHMEDMWGYRLAVQPSEKAYRPSHRASIHDAILHDASYYSWTEINGPEVLLKTMLDKACDPQKAGPSSQRYTPGSRTLDTHIYKLGLYPFGLIAPATIMWRPVVTSSAEAPETTKGATTSKQDPKGKGKEKAPFQRTFSNDPLCQRSIWIKVHPSMYEETFKVLQEAASQTLAEYTNQNNDSTELKLEFIDLRGHVNVFEIMGPKSSQVLKGVLKPVQSDKRPDFLNFWSSLGDLQSSGCLARGMIVGFKVNDPRLSFPPKNAKPKKQNTSDKHIFPSSQLAENELWDEQTRRSLATPTFTKHQLDQRREKKDVPGSPLDNLRQDNRIPVILIQRSLETPGSNDSQAIHGWTVIIPAGWSMAFWTSFVYTGTRVGGQRERQTQAFEAGTTYFPRDYPATPSFESWATRIEAKEKEKWGKKPPAKRVNYEKLDTKHPWKANWLGALGIESRETQTGQEDFVTAQREPFQQEPAVSTIVEPSIQPWLLRGAEVARVVSNLTSSFNKAGTLVSEMNRLRLKRNLDPLPNDIKSEHVLQGALVNVRVKMCSRGTPEDLAMIYKFDDDVVRQWEKALRFKQVGGVGDEETLEETALASKVPSQDSTVGYVTTGHYSLSRGHGYGLGAIALTKLLDLAQQSHRLRSNRAAKLSLPTMIIGVRNIDGMHCRAAYLDILPAD